MKTPVANIQLPERSMTWRTSSSSGPGGQNVNRRSTRVELLVDLDELGLDVDQVARVRSRLSSRVDAAGILRIVCDQTRSQHRNKTLAKDRAQLLIDDALKVEKIRKPTLMPASINESRLKDKAHTSAKKQSRRWSFDQD